MVFDRPPADDPGRTGRPTVEGVKLKQQIELKKLEIKAYKHAFKAKSALETFDEVMVRIGNTDFGPLKAFFSASESWFKAGGAEGMESLYETIFNEDNIAAAKNLTTEFGRLATEGIAALVTEIDRAIPGLTGITLAIYSLYLSFGPWGIAILGLIAGITALTEAITHLTAGGLIEDFSNALEIIFSGGLVGAGGLF